MPTFLLNIRKFFVSFIFINLGILTLQAQRNLYFEAITSPGLLTPVTRAVTTDKEGRVYVGTNDGFYRYDGYKFDKYPVTGPDSLACAIHNIRCLHYDGGNIWIGGVEGLAKLNIATGKFKYFKPDAKEIQAGHHPLVSSIVQIDNKLYLGTYKSFIIIDLATQTRKSVSLPEQIKSIYTYSFCKDESGKIWIGTGNDGVLIYDPLTEGITTLNKHFKDFADLPSNTIYTIIDRHHGNFWIGSEKGLFSVNTKNGELKQLNLFTETGEKIFPEIRKMISDEQNNVYIVTFGAGLFFYDAGTGRFTNYTYTDRWLNSLPDNSINCIARGSNDIYWIVSEDAGLAKINPWFFKYEYTLVPPFNLTKNNLNITDTRVIGTDTWLTSSAGLIKYDASKKFTFFSPLAQGFTKDYCQTMVELNNDYLSFMLYEGGVAVFNMRTLKFGYLQPPGKSISGNKPVFDWLSYCDKDKNIYMSTREGSYFRCNYNRSTVDTLFTNETVKLNYPVVIPEPDNNNLWIIATSKLYHYNIHERKLINISNDKNGNELPPVSFQEDVIAKNNGIIYIASDEGFFRYDRNKNVLQRFTVTEGLPDNNCFSLFMDNTDQIFISYQGGIILFNEQTNAFTTYPMPALKATSSGVFFDSRNNLYMGAENCFIQVNQNDLASYPGKPLLNVTQIKAGNRTFSSADITSANAIKINYDDFPIIIEYALTDHMNPEKNKVHYLLEGWDQLWITDDKKNFKAIYSYLTPGNYTFKIEGDNGFNKTDAVLKIPIEIMPPFWQTWWFVTGCLLLLAAAVYSIYKYRLNQLLKLQSVRNKIASDLHDDVGSTLSSIRMYSDIVSSQVKDTNPQSTILLDKISSNSKEMIENMSDIVWMIKPGNDDFKSIESRMLNFANELCTQSGISFDFVIEGSLEDIRIPMEQRRDIYLIFKEAVNNAVKYSGCHGLRAVITSQNNQLQMCISDDGNGFDAGIASNGNGLSNMKKRAETNRGNFKINSSLGEGTEIVVSFKV